MTARNILMAAAGGSTAANYIEDVFSTYLYTGNGSTQTITNGIDLAGKGGMVWLKSRGPSGYNHYLYDTNRGATNVLFSNLTNASGTQANGLTAFNNNGFTQGSFIGSNGTGENYASWTFRKAPKFFDVVTYTGTGSVQNIAHNLGSVPGCMIVKGTTQANAGNWNVYHRSIGSGNRLILNTTDASLSAATTWNNTDPTATQFTVGTSSQINNSGDQYVAYLFAHDAGGFGLTGTDNVISCGITDSGGNAILGFEPQWILAKDPNNVDNWKIIDTMRGWRNGSTDNYLFANTSGAEGTNGGLGHPTATGFTLDGGTHIYIAIRRGPMKVPTDATKVFSPVTYTGNGTAGTTTTGIVTDLLISRGRNHASYPLNALLDRLRGATRYLLTNSYGGAYFGDQAEATGTNTITSFANMSGVAVGTDAVGFCNIDTIQYVNWALRRAPNFFDEVCYSGSGSATTVSHNLGVAPELIFVKSRSNARDWAVYQSGLGATKYLNLNNASVGGTSSTYWNDTSPTDSVFSVGTTLEVNSSGWTYVAYLFASCPGVSKVGSYTGTGTTQQINCGFTAGARFVLIKRTDSTGDWYVWDSARGIVAGNDPYLLLNSNSAEVTSTDYIDTYSAGFEISSTAPAAINASGGTFIYLAIA